LFANGVGSVTSFLVGESLVDDALSGRVAVWLRETDGVVVGGSTRGGRFLVLASPFVATVVAQISGVRILADIAFLVSTRLNNTVTASENTIFCQWVGLSCSRRNICLGGENVVEFEEI